MRNDIHSHVVKLVLETEQGRVLGWHLTVHPASGAGMLSTDCDGMQPAEAPSVHSALRAIRLACEMLLEADTGA